MNNKRNWIILAVILLLLIGLGAYVFAGSGEELLNSGNGNSSETENSGNTTNTENTLDEEEEEESNTNTESDNNTGGTNTNTLTVTAVDTSYDDAEAAVAKAESTLTQDDVDSATALIAAVTTGTDTSSLTERLEAVQSLIDLTNLVNTLKSYVDDATSLSDITDARTYESTNTIISLVESLDASDTKTSLTNIINSISSILEDETSPVISVSTLNSESYASSAITVTVTEDNDYTIYLDGVETTLSELSSLTDGTYTIKVVDASYNEQSVTFTIDTTSPTATIVADNTVTNGKINFTVTVVDDNIDTVEYAFSGYTTLENLATLSADRWVSVTLDENNEFTITRTSIDAYLWVKVTDKAGNVSYIKSDDKYMIDKEAPTITVSDYTGNIEENSYSEIKLIIEDNYNLASISINGEVINISGTEYELTIDNTYDDGEYEIIVIDEAGNSEDFTFYLDVTNPQIIIANTEYTVGGLNESNVYSKLGVKVTDDYGLEGLYINDNLVKNIVGVTNNNYNKIETYFANYLNEGEENTIYVIDLAGNKSNVITFVYDTTAASIAYTSYKTSDNDTASNTLSYWTNTLKISMASNEKLGQSATVTITDSEGTEFVYTASLEYDFVNSGGQYIYTTTYDLPDGIAEGEVTITISDVYDLAGNETEAFNYKYYEKTIIVDTTAGTATISTSNYFINSSRVSIDVTIDEENIDSVYYTFSGYADEDSLIANKKSDEWVSQTYLDSSNSFTITWDITGSTYLWIKIVDKAGNVGYVRSDKFVLDTESPVIYANDSETISSYYNEDVTIKVTDDNIELPIKVEYTDADNNTATKEYDTDEFELEEDGTYSITAVDKAGNTSTVTFVIDKTSPVVTLYKYEKEYTGRTELAFDGYYSYSLAVSIEDDNSYTAILTDATGKEYEFTEMAEIGSRANYTLTVTDAAGNVTVVEFAIDKDKPKITGVSDGDITNENVTAVATDTNLDKVVLYKNGELVNGYENGSEISDDGTYIITATDKAGNSTSVTFTIDKTAPTATFSPEAGYYNEYTTINVSIDDDNIAEAYYLRNESGTLIDNIVNGKWSSLTITNNTTSMAFAADGFSFYLWVKLVDKAGNVSYIGSDGLYVIDTEAPTITGVEEGKIYTSAITPSVTDDYELESVKLYIDGVEQTYQVGDTIQTGSGKYQLVATDKAGNETTVNFRMSKISTTITLTAPNSLVYDATVKEYTAVVTDEDGNVLNDVTVQYNYSDGTNSKIAAVNAGDYSVAAYYAGDDTYKAAYVYKTFTIEKATVYVEFGTGNLIYTGSGLEYGYTIYRGDTDITNSGEISYVVTYKSTDGGTTGNCTIDNGTQKSGCVLPTDIGSYTISITVRENDNYNYSSGIYTGFKIVGSTSINGVSYKTVAAAISAANQWEFLMM